MTSDQELFRAAIRKAIEAFHLPEHRKELADLSPRFWTALLDLELACDSGDWEELRSAFVARWRLIGTPGDFGYETPCGDALRKAYDAWNTACRTSQVAKQQV